jgi:hypothetical protein
MQHGTLSTTMLIGKRFQNEELHFFYRYKTLMSIKKRFEPFIFNYFEIGKIDISPPPFYLSFLSNAESITYG